MASYVLCQPINYMLKYFKYFIYKYNRHVATKKTIFLFSRTLKCKKWQNMTFHIKGKLVHNNMN